MNLLLSEPKVVLLSYTPDLERICSAAMRSCYSPRTASELYMKPELHSDADVARMIEKALQLGHHDVLEHGVLTFSIEGVSRALSHQLVRHRIASFSQQSQRHVRVARDADWYVKPPLIPGEEKVSVDVDGLKIDLTYEKFIRISEQFYSGLTEKGSHKEDARFVIPTASKTNIAMTANPRSYRHIFGLRCDSAAQWEIQDVCWAMLAAAKLVSPTIFKTLENPAAQDQKALEKLARLDSILVPYREAFQKARRGDVLALDLGDLGLTHDVQTIVLHE